jgi:hypothetical protein
MAKHRHEPGPPMTLGNIRKSRAVTLILSIASLLALFDRAPSAWDEVSQFRRLGDDLLRCLAILRPPCRFDYEHFTKKIALRSS